MSTSVFDQVLDVIRGHRFRYTNEDELQEGIAAVLAPLELDIRREVRLSDRDRIDVLVNGSIGIEVKVAGKSAGVFEQLQRYAEHDEIESLILVTSRWARLPAEVGGKPLTTVSLAVTGL